MNNNLINSFLYFINSLAFGSLDGKIAIYNIFSKEEVFQFVTAHKQEIYNLFFYEQQFQIIAICADNSISAWDYRNLKKIDTLNSKRLEKNSSKKVRASVYFKEKDLFLIYAEKLTVIIKILQI